MTERIAEKGPWPNARITGVVYLLYFLTAIAAVVLVRGLVVLDDAAATANNILTHESLLRSGFAVGLIGTALYVAVTGLFYQLFKPVNRSLALLAVLFSVVGCTMQAADSLLQAAPFVILGGERYLSVFRPEQLQSLALLSLKLNAQAGYIYIVFFGLFDILIGYLIFRSKFLPRILGVPMMIAGLGWLSFLAPSFAMHFSSYIDVVGFVAELLLMLWLLVMGINVPRWREQAAR